MAHVQYQTSVPWDSTLADLGYTSDGYVESAVKTTTGAPTATAGKFIPAAQILNKVSGITYTNTGSTASPTWTALGGGGGGIAIGDTVTGSNKNRILFIDGGTELIDDANFTREVDGQTLFSSTFGTDVVSYSMDSDIFSIGAPGIGTKIVNTGGDTATNILANGGGLVSSIFMNFVDTSLSYQNIAKNTYGLVINGTTAKQSEVNITDVSTEVISKDGSNSYGTKTLNGVTTLGKTSGSSPTKVIVDAINSTVTVTNVPTYADDAAAATGGLTSGMLYKTTTGGITALNIVP